MKIQGWFFFINYTYKPFAGTYLPGSLNKISFQLKNRRSNNWGKSDKK